MKKILAAIFVLLLAAVLQISFALADTEAKVTIMNFNSGEDEQTFGFITQITVSLGTDNPVQINMDEIFDLYPEHNGIYGILWTEEPVILTGNGDATQSVSGKGTMEFSFPGATTCTLTGSGVVYAYFLPVPYMRLSTDISLTYQKFNTNYLTQTSVNHQHMFMVADPHSFVFQGDIPDEGTVYKYSSGLGKIPPQYEIFAENEEYECPMPFLYDNLVLVQCDALTLEAYENDTFFIRPMIQAAVGNGYEIWWYKDYQPESATIDRIIKIFDACIDLAYQQFLPDSRSFDPIIMMLLEEEIKDYGAHGLNVSRALIHQIGFQNHILYNTAALESTSDFLYYLFAHEIGHIVHHMTLSSNPIFFSSWISEGFAEFFAEKVCNKIGVDFPMRPGLNNHDVLAIDKFKSDMVFGITGISEYLKVMDNDEILILPDNTYAFGYLFMKYLDDIYGEGFYKNISEKFYQELYKGYEDRFFRREHVFTYNVDLYFATFKHGLSDDVYLNYPAYVQEHYVEYISQ